MAKLLEWACLLRRSLYFWRFLHEFIRMDTAEIEQEQAERAEIRNRAFRGLAQKQAKETKAIAKPQRTQRTQSS